MSKNISIQEGGTAKTMTVNKLKTTLVAGGTCLWVPEDEVSLGTKHITENGTYTASEDGKYGYSQVTVNVPGGAGSATSSGTPTSSGGSTPGGIGSSVVGTDPTDGNEYAVGVDDDGNLVKTKVPSSIAVVKDPNKTEYVDGETIDYSGIIVSLKGGDGEPFANSDYPNGHVPISELTFPVETAEASEDAEYYSDGAGVNAMLVHIGPTQITYFGYRNYVSPVLGSDNAVVGSGEERDVYLTRYNNNLYVRPKEGSSSSSNYLVKTDSSGGFNAASDNQNYIVNGYVWGKLIKNADSFTSVPVSTSDPINSTGELVADKQVLPVKWDSPYDGRTFEASFEITVTAAQETGGDEGGGGGHSF